MEDIPNVQDNPTYASLHSLGPLGHLDDPPTVTADIQHDPRPVQYSLTVLQLQEMITSAVSSALQKRGTRVVLNDTTCGDETTVPLEPDLSLDPPLFSKSPQQPLNSSPALLQRSSPTFSGTRLVETRYIPTEFHRITSTVTQAEIVKYCISPNSHDKHFRLSRLHIALKSTGLLSMLLRHRKKPVIEHQRVY